MILSMKDWALKSRISGEMALRYVEKNELECNVLRYALGVGTGREAGYPPQAPELREDRLCRIWQAINSYDAGEMCREWLCGPDNPLTLRVVMDDMMSMDETRK